MRATLAMTKVQLRILRNDPWFLVIMFGMPLVVMPLFKQTMGLSLVASGFEGASGAEQVVPGQVVLFGFFVGGSAGFSIFREHGWKTWDRLRASSASPVSLLAGIAIPWIMIHVAYQAVLFLAGGLALGLRFNGGSPVAALLTMFGYSVVVISLIMLAASSFRTVHQLSAVQNVGAMAFGGLGGALVPHDQLPGWAQAVAPFTPAYWAMDGFRSVFLEAGGIDDVLVPLAVMLGAGAVLSALAARRFRADETKEFFA
ncbi:MAG: ABC transporter permease [Actinomycetia bacterium]|nr:ABC transporter permease [Actinomycetes bacterium]MCP4960514.1 ABC transporter permease [Actinomycetes bacterium]